MEITLIPYSTELEIAADMLTQFWKEHDVYPPGYAEACEDVAAWTKGAHSLYLIHLDWSVAGFVHLICPAGNGNCRAEIFVLSQFRRKGIDAVAVSLAEEILKSNFETRYPAAKPEDVQFQRIYQEIGYSCPASVASRKTFKLGSHK